MSSIEHPQCDRRSITQKLEAAAWRNHPGFARQLARRNFRVQKHRQQQLRAHSPRNHWPAWRDRVLPALWFILTVLLLLHISKAEAQEAASIATNQDPWGLEFLGDGQHFRNVAFNTDIEAEITGLVARIDVRQRFRNTGSAWAEAVYRFPLPEGAAVDRLQIEAGGRILEGEIQEKQVAQRLYQQGKAEGMVAALVEQQHANQFETRLANIGPDEEITISISFLAHVDYRDSAFSLQIPLTFTPRWNVGIDSVSQPVAPTPTIKAADEIDDHYLTLNIRLRSGLSIASLESRYHDMDIHPALGGYNLFLADPDTRTDRVFELNWKPDFGRGPESALMTWDGGEAVYAMLMLAPPLPEAVVPQSREVVFVIDTSGSMAGVSLQQARAALYLGLDQLEDDDRFNLIQFNSDSEVLFSQSVPPDAASLTEAMDFIDSLVADGGTNIAPALRDAMALPALAGWMRQIVFITDGSVDNEEELLLQIADDLGESRLFTVSIGSAPNSWFLRKAAAIGRGNHTHIGRLDEVTERMTSLWQRIENPALQDICIDWGMEAEYFPEIIPDLYAGEPLWLFARLPAEPREVTLCGDLNGQPWEQVRTPLPGKGSENIATLWARSKIEALQDSRMFGLDPELIRLEVTAVALEFGLITPYTSLVAVDHTPVRPAGQNLQGNDISSLLPAGSSANSVGFSPTATGWLAQLLLSFATLFSAACLLWFGTPSLPARAGGQPPPPKPVRKPRGKDECISHSAANPVLIAPQFVG